MNPELERRLTKAGLDPESVLDLVRRALHEDGDADVTSEPIFAPSDTAAGEYTARAAGVVAGLPVAEVVFELLGIDATTAVADGARVRPGQALINATGPTRAMLRAERTALNFLTHLSGIATLTAAWADAIAGSRARVRDTRKTLPGLRELEKYAVRCGGGVNHRMGLHDAALIKDNHIAAAGSLTAAYRAIRDFYPSLHVQVECDTLQQVREAIAVGATSVLLDNMSNAEMAEAVRMVAAGDRRVELEASGGLALAGAEDAAATGVDYLAVGALTHSAPAFDIGLDFL